MTRKGVGTLRTLLTSCNHKSVFNFLYSHYYKDHPTEEVNEIALAYRKVWDELLLSRQKP